jgi:tRNA (guanine37-N1)-methyltransferase
MDVPTSFETVGHIAHLNLRDEQLPYKLLVGRVLLEKNAGRIKTVLNKVLRLIAGPVAPRLTWSLQVGTIDSEFRVPEFEVLAGDTCLEARHPARAAWCNTDAMRGADGGAAAWQHLPPRLWPSVLELAAGARAQAVRLGGVWALARVMSIPHRLVDTFKAGEVVCDMMAGIGPFAIPAARRRVTVHANDLNPQCAHYLRLNARLNKVRCGTAWRSST